MARSLKYLLACLLLASVAHGQTVLLNKFGPVSGVLVGTAGNPATTAAAIADLQPILSTTPGLVLNGATGGAKGAGTVNATGLYVNGSAVGVGGGAVSSVGLTAPTCFGVTGSPVTSAGSLGLTISGTTAEYVDGTGACQMFPTIPTGANPTATVGPTANNGSAVTFMRSDASPAMCLSCSFNWTGTHTFTLATFDAVPTATTAFVAGATAVTNDPRGGGSIFAGFMTNRSVTTTGDYGFADFSTVTPPSSGTNGSASFNDRRIIGGTNNLDHHHSFQAWPIFAGTGTLNELDGVWVDPEVDSGTVSNIYEFHALIPSLTGSPTVGTIYGLRIESLFGVGTTQWAVYTVGETPSYMGGGLTIGGVSGDPVAALVSSGDVTSYGLGSGTGCVNLNTGGVDAFLACNATAPGYQWMNTAAGTNDKIWDAIADTTPQLHFRMVNDAHSAATDWLTVTRSGTTASVINLQATSVEINGVALSTSTGANPSAVIGLTANNGSANTFTRSDGSPALSQAISPTWTGTHLFNGPLVAVNTTTGITLGDNGGSPEEEFINSSGGTDNKLWDFYADTTTWHGRTVNDAHSAAQDWIAVLRSGVSITSITLPQGGLVVGSPTSGSCGTGCVNASALEINGVAVNTTTATLKVASGTMTTSSGTCTINENTAGSIGSCVSSGAGAATITATGFSTGSCSVSGSGSVIATINGALAGNTQAIQIHNFVGTSVDGQFSVVCTGQ